MWYLDLFNDHCICCYSLQKQLIFRSSGLLLLQFLQNEILLSWWMAAAKGASTSKESTYVMVRNVHGT